MPDTTTGSGSEPDPDRSASDRCGVEFGADPERSSLVATRGTTVARDRQRRYALGAVQLDAIVKELRRDVERVLSLHVRLRLAGWDDVEVGDLVRARSQLDAVIATLERQATDFRAGAPARCRYCQCRLDGRYHQLDETRCVFAPSATFGGRLSSRYRSWQLIFDPEIAHVP